MDQRTYFQGNPTRLDISRSKFNLNHKFTTTAVAGRLQPCIAYPDILPGDTFKLDLSFVCRSTTPVAPTMDDQEIQIEFYFVPHKLVLSRAYMSPSISDANHSFAAFIGAQDSLLNMPLPADVMMPNLNLPFGKNMSVLSANSAPVLGTTNNSSWQLDCVLSQLGYPFQDNASGTADTITNYFMSPIPLLAFYSVWNENYRDPNLMAGVVFSINAVPGSVTGSEIRFTKNDYAGIYQGTGSDSGWIAYGFPVVCAYHGYFGSCLPWPQRNSTQVQVPLGSIAPVFAGNDDWDVSDTSVVYPLRFKDFSNQFTFGQSEIRLSNGGVLARGGNTSSTLNADITPSNLFADLSNAAGPSVNALRLAIQTQRLYEAWARGGNRLSDMTQIFGVIPHDAADDKPEFLGGKRIPINITQVNQTAQGTSPVGTTGAFSNTSDTSHYFTKSFDTWGTLIGVYCIRHKDTFANMLPRYLTRKTRLDYYWPQFANLGEAPVLKQEKYFQNVPANDSGTLGFQEYGAEYRMLPDRIAGAVSPMAGAGQTYWTYSSKHTEVTLLDYLSAERMKTETDQTLAVQSSAAGFQYLIQFYFDITAVRPMPLYSIPGLMDHH